MTKLAWSKAGPRLVQGSMIGRDGLMTAISKAVRRTEDRTLEGLLSFALLYCRRLHKSHHPYISERLPAIMSCIMDGFAVSWTLP